LNSASQGGQGGCGGWDGGEGRAKGLAKKKREEKCKKV